MSDRIQNAIIAAVGWLIVAFLVGWAFARGAFGAEPTLAPKKGQEITIEVTAEVVEPIQLVEVSIPGCLPCARCWPVLAGFARSRGLRGLYLDASENREFLDYHQVPHGPYPLLLLMRGNKVLARRAGAIDEATLATWVASVTAAPPAAGRSPIGLLGWRRILDALPYKPLPKTAAEVDPWWARVGGPCCSELLKQMKKELP